MPTFTLRRALLLAFTALVLLGCLQTRLDQSATEEIDSGFQRALATFAAARTLGAVLSVAQGTQVEVQPAGVGMSFAPGQALQPLNELVDHFADLMLLASVAFGIQALLLKLGTHAVVSALLAATVVGWAALRWRGGGNTTGSPVARWLQPLLVLLLLLRLALPLGAVANEALYRHFMADDYHSALTTIDQSPGTLMGHTVAAPTGDEGWLDRMRNWLKGLPDVKAGYDAILKAASGWSERMVRLIAIFMVQTVVLPLAFLWLAWRLAWLTLSGGRSRVLAREDS